LESRIVFFDGKFVMTLVEKLSDALTLGMAREDDILRHDGPLADMPESQVEAAVLVAITDRAEPGVILTQRPHTMRKHPGQVAFPGGRLDTDDADHVAGALREAYEEIALPPSAVHVIGAADAYRTVTGYLVTPIIGVIAPDLPLVANDGEVEAIFEVPLAFLMNPVHHALRDVDWNGQMRTYYEMMWEDRRIWGATAAMIVNLSRRLAWA
jgi:8-oxo-dGTP pyrophosphatase MutT (NUDIX family)